MKSEIYQADTSANAAPGTLINIGQTTELVFTANTSGSNSGGGSGGSGSNTSDWTVSQVIQLAGQGFDNSASGQLSSNYQGAIADLNYANTQPEDVSAGLPAWISGSGLALARNAANTYTLIQGFRTAPRRTLVATVLAAVGNAYRDDRNLGASVNSTTQAITAIDQIINGRTPLAQGLGVLNLVSTFNPQNATLAGAGQIGGALSSLIGLQSTNHRIQPNAIKTVALRADFMPGNSSKRLQSSEKGCQNRFSRRFTTKRRALCAGSMPGRGRNRSINQRKSNLTRLPQAHAIIVKG